MPVAQTMDALRALIRALRINARAVESEFGMSVAQLFVLQQLADRPASSLNELAARTATHQSSVSVVVRRLVHRGLVLRLSAPTDRRRIELAITHAGAALLAKAPRTVQMDLVASLRTMTPEQQRQLAGMLTLWISRASVRPVLRLASGKPKGRSRPASHVRSRLSDPIVKRAFCQQLCEVALPFASALDLDRDDLE